MKLHKAMEMLTIFHLALLSGLFLVVLIQAQDQSGFISIDCGGTANFNYTETVTGINYISDANFISTGVIKSIATDLKDKYQRMVWNLRSFPDGIRNCYKINITRGSKYLIRVSFLYGNYDGLNNLPQFDLLLGVNLWDTVNIHDASMDQDNEIIHTPSQNYIQICLVNKGTGTPFISAIFLRILKNDTYVTESGSLITFFRWDLGSNTNRTYRYKYDAYDRVWNPYHNNDWTQISSSVPVGSLIQNHYQPPEIVMSTAATPVNASAPLAIISWQPTDQTEQYYFYMHFVELQVLGKNQTRQFNIKLNDKTWYQNLVPTHLNTLTIFSRSGTSGRVINCSLEKTKSSTLPPIINAIEVYRLKEFKQSDTFQGDVDAVTTIKSVYGVTKNWQGDPCGPVAYMWDGINCTYDVNNSPRITTLNLSSSKLRGQIDPSISKLTMLEKLDLSNNSLNDEVPEFLSQLQNLKILNLENNNLTGSLPSELVKKSKDGSLSLSVGQNPNLCESDQCNKKKKKNIITPLAASVSGILILLVAVAAIFWTYKKRKPQVGTARREISAPYTEEKDTLKSLQLKKQIYSYSEVIEITNNFNTIVGKGGFGTVYLGYIDDIPVAVKMLSLSSVQGYQQFQAEVKLLMRIHHRNLNPLIGYCNEGTNKGLIYEYMANGDLQEHLSGKYNKTKFLSWEDRLRIAVDASLGLEYLHNGCKPPIIHRDVKSPNILLTENFQAKISDFGLSKIFPTDGETHVSTVVAGTPGYLDPDYSQSNRLTEKSDVYSFGVVLLELITSKPVISRNHEKTHISQWVKSMVDTGDIKGIVDSRLGGDFEVNSVWKAVETAMSCVSQNPNRRPMMSAVVNELKECLAKELARTKYGGANSGESIEMVSINVHADFTPLARYKDDGYDRFWFSYSVDDWKLLNGSKNVSGPLSKNQFQQPAAVMITAATAVNASAPLVITWTPASAFQNTLFYFYMHFMEIEQLDKNQTREFIMDGKLLQSNFVPSYLSTNTIISVSTSVNISLEMPPITNAIEIYRNIPRRC